MKRSLLALAVAASTAVAITVPVLAQQQKAPAAEAPKAPAAQAPKVQIPRGVFLRGQQADHRLARTALIGQKIYNREGRIVADIEDLIIDRDNQIVGVIIGTGGFLGVGEKRIGVRLSALQTGRDGKITIPAMTKEVVAALEPYKLAEPRRGLIDRAKDKAKELTDRAVETTKDAAAAAREKAGPALERAKDATKGAIEKAKDATKGAVDRAKEAVQPKAQ